MKRLIFLFALVFGIILLSGCTYPQLPFGGEEKKPNLLPEIKAYSDLQEVYSNDSIWVYVEIKNPNPTTPGAEEEYTYNINCTLKSAGLFEVMEAKGGAPTLKPTQATTYQYLLKAPIVSVRTPTKVIFEVSFEKTSHFYFSALFIDENYKKELEIAGKKIPKGQRYFSFSDNLINLNLELNKDYYLARKDRVYGNIKYSSSFEEIEVESLRIWYFDKTGKKHKVEVMDCDRITKTCSFSLPSEEVSKSFEKKYEIEVRYKVKKTVSLDFEILEERIEKSPKEIPEEVPEEVPEEEVPSLATPSSDEFYIIELSKSSLEKKRINISLWDVATSKENVNYWTTPGPPGSGRGLSEEYDYPVAYIDFYEVKKEVGYAKFKGYYKKKITEDYWLQASWYEFQKPGLTNFDVHLVLTKEKYYCMKEKPLKGDHIDKGICIHYSPK